MAVAFLLAILFITIIVVYLFLAHPWWFPAGASSIAATVDGHFKVAFLLVGILFVSGQLLLAASLLSSRQKRSQKNLTPSGNKPNLSGNWRLEALWTVGITCLFVWFNASGERLWSEITVRDLNAEKIEIEVTGTQFQWYFRYPGADGAFGRTDPQRWAKPDEGNPLGMDPNDDAGRDDIVSTTLMLPQGRDIDFTLKAFDVIHSMFIPAMRFKQDTVPGMIGHAHFRPTEAGSYEMVCSQLCGLGHYRMRATVKVVSEQDFKRWLNSMAQPKETTAQ
ncbi:MAG TPA: cytochrome C oxidase subunit II [Candidatus Angelobacter sp.]|nr:cytochrome C oxidase subunit II [Candidatus Angelobacter sp.]